MELTRLLKIDDKIVYNDNGVFKDCMCTYNQEYEGLSISYTDICTTCNGKKTFSSMRGNKQINVKCKTCGGDGYVRLDKPKINGKCEICNGTLKDYNILKTDTIHVDDVKLLSELIDFENTKGSENTKQTFNEGYLGIGIVGGITDYGRYLKMSEEEFKQEVLKNFLSGYHQYCHFIRRDKMVNSIIIKKHDSGWSLIPIF